MGGDSGEGFSGETTSGETGSNSYGEASNESNSSSEVSSNEISDAFGESSEGDFVGEPDNNSDIDADVTSGEVNAAFGEGDPETGDSYNDTAFSDNPEKGFSDNPEKGEAASNVSEADISDLPPNVRESFANYENEGWTGPHNDATPGTRGGGEFSNRDGDLPTVDNKGAPISYKEFDVNNKPTDGTGRDGERFVIGSDGSVYYTGDHYETFTKIR